MVSRALARAGSGVRFDDDAADDAAASSAAADSGPAG